MVLLGLNPGFKRADARYHRGDPDFIASLRQNLVHATAAYPNYLLDPRNADAPGGRWWRRRLRQPIRDFGLEVVARRVLVLELFPYHSKQFGRAVVPSQAYTYHLLRRAIRRDALVIVMRGWRLWTLAVPEVLTHEHCYRLSSARNVAVSERSCRDGYPELVRRLRGRRG